MRVVGWLPYRHAQRVARVSRTWRETVRDVFAGAGSSVVVDGGGVGSSIREGIKASTTNSKITLATTSATPQPPRPRTTHTSFQPSYPLTHHNHRPRPPRPPRRRYLPGPDVPEAGDGVTLVLTLGWDWGAREWSVEVVGCDEYTLLCNSTIDSSYTTTMSTTTTAGIGGVGLCRADSRWSEFDEWLSPPPVLPHAPLASHTMTKVKVTRFRPVTFDTVFGRSGGCGVGVNGGGGGGDVLPVPLGELRSVRLTPLVSASSRSFRVVLKDAVAAVAADADTIDSNAAAGGDDVSLREELYNDAVGSSNGIPHPLTKRMGWDNNFAHSSSSLSSSSSSLSSLVVGPQIILDDLVMDPFGGGSSDSPISPSFSVASTTTTMAAAAVPRTLKCVIGCIPRRRRQQRNIHPQSPAVRTATSTTAASASLSVPYTSASRLIPQAQYSQAIFGPQFGLIMDETGREVESLVIVSKCLWHNESPVSPVSPNSTPTIAMAEKEKGAKKEDKEEVKTEDAILVAPLGFQPSASADVTTKRSPVPRRSGPLLVCEERWAQLVQWQAELAGGDCSSDFMTTATAPVSATPATALSRRLSTSSSLFSGSAADSVSLVGSSRRQRDGGGSGGGASGIVSLAELVSCRDTVAMRYYLSCEASERVWAFRAVMETLISGHKGDERLGGNKAFAAMPGGNSLNSNSDGRGAAFDNSINNSSSIFFAGQQALDDLISRINKINHRVEVLCQVDVPGTQRLERLQSCFAEASRAWLSKKGAGLALRVSGYTGRVENEEGVYEHLVGVLLPVFSE